MTRMLAKWTPLRISLFLVAAAMLVSCGSRWPSERTWKEEVRLSDGRVIQVERHERYRVLSELGGLTTLITEDSELRVLPTPGQGLPLLKIGDGKMWVVPLIVDVDVATGAYFAISMVETSYDAEAAGLDTRKPYFEYRLIDGVWKRQPVSDEKLGWNTNLLLSHGLARKKDFVPLAEKEAADSDGRISSEYKCVRMSNWEERCSWPRELSWKEGVRLSDGRAIAVERHERYRVPSEPESVGRASRRETSELRILPAPNEALPLLKTGGGKISEVPLIVDQEVDTGTYFAITFVDHDDEAESAGLDPRSPYFEYRLTDGAWKRQPVSEQKIGRKSNLLIGLSVVKRRGFVSLDKKEAANDGAQMAPEYRCVRISTSGVEC